LKKEPKTFGCLLWLGLIGRRAGTDSVSIAAGFSKGTWLPPAYDHAIGGSHGLDWPLRQSRGLECMASMVFDARAIASIST